MLRTREEYLLKNPICDANALNRSDCSLRAHQYQNYHGGNSKKLRKKKMKCKNVKQSKMDV